MGLSGNAGLQSSLVVSTLSITGNAGAFQLMTGAQTAYSSSTNNWVSNGVLTVAVQDDIGNGLDANELARLNDAMQYLNDSLGSMGVLLTWADSGANADVHIHFANTTPQGGTSDGVLAFTTASNDVYFVSGGNFYTGSDASALAANQFDFQTLSIHELAHTVGLGESIDANSVMYEYLSAGTTRRTFTESNLAKINTNADRFMKVGGNAQSNAALLVAGQSAGREALGNALIQKNDLPLSANFDPITDLPARQDRVGGGNDILIGGAGDDILIGGSGRDIMIGGTGKDMVIAGDGGDILVSSSTNDDANVGGLRSVLAEWSSTDSYTLRVSKVSGVNVASGVPVLDSTDVQTDSQVDTLVGGDGRD